MKEKLQIAGLWHNQHRSEIDLSQSENGQITGAFKTCTQGMHKEYPLTGFAHDDVVAFCVNFIEHGSITAWVGQIQYQNEKPFLNTLWHMSTEMGKYEARDDKSWKSILSGADRFYRGPAISMNGEGETESIAQYPPYLVGARKASIY